MVVVVVGSAINSRGSNMKSIAYSSVTVLTV